MRVVPIKLCERCGSFAGQHRPSLDADGRWPLHYVDCPLTRFEVEGPGWTREKKLEERQRTEDYLETMRKGCNMTREQWERFRDDQTELRDRSG
jgi:hypothetical protein